MHPDIPDKLYIVQIHQPVRVVHHQGFGAALLQAIAEFNKAAHLLLKALAVVGNCLFGHHCPQIASSGGISDHARAAADEGNGPVSCHLQPLHQAQRHKMPYMQTVRRGVKSDVEGGLTIVDQFLNLFLVCQLRQKASGFQFLKYCHFSFPCLSCIIL